MTISYREGDLFQNLQAEDCIIHCNNNLAAWGAGFVVPLGENFPEAKEAYHYWFKHPTDCYPKDIHAVMSGEPTLGNIQLVNIYSRAFFLRVINMIAQNGTISSDNPHPLDYQALTDCLTKVKKYTSSATRIVCPLFGSKLAGGHWPTIAKIVDDVLAEYNVNVFYLDKLPEGTIINNVLSEKEE
jgi:hypothetical protein